ncbi:MAG: acyltransferase domain-containing protein, partial [Acidimicrobiales bacterium]|nr:acyltransferase domain-containing protein [Acidimicrobiales bacterium]
IRPFDRSADGLLIGEGTGMVVLKRLADAERDGDRVYAVVRGTGVASDGRASSVMKPRVDGQLLALERAWRDAGVDPATVGLVEAHGTATPVGDEAELTTLGRFFGPADGRGPAGGRAVVGSVKSMIGHTMPAAGAAALIKAALAVHHGVLPPTLHVDEPHEALAATRFATLGAAEPWGEGDGPRRAGVNAFGFGGINAHVVLERVVLLAGASADDLLAQLDDPAILVDRDDAGRAAVGAEPAGPWRLAMVAPDERRLTLARKVVARGTPWRGRNDVWFSPHGLVRDGGKVAFVFPGVEPEFDPQVDDVAAHFGLPLGPLEHAEGEALHLGLHGAGIIALGRLLDAALGELGLRPDVVAGHSIGEWNAMIAAHLIPDDDIDEFIDSVDTDDVDVPGVVFAALGCGADAAAAAVGDRVDVVVSHDNCPHQSIICGSETGVAEVMATLRADRVLAQELPFRSGFHSPMLAPYVEPVRASTARVPLQAPVVPVWSATTVAPYPDDPAAVRDLVVRHLLEPVRFRELALRLHDEGVRVFVQVGQGSLVNFLDDTLKGRDHLSVAAAGPR